MNPTIDDIFREARALSTQLDHMPESDPNRSSLISRRDRLRAKAQTLSDARRHPVSVENEIAMLQARLDEIDALFIAKGYSEKHLTKGFSDPGAYSAEINHQLGVEHASEIAKIDRRLAELRRIELRNDGA